MHVHTPVHTPYNSSSGESIASDQIHMHVTTESGYKPHAIKNKIKLNKEIFKPIMSSGK